ncbi:MAG: MBL fold metallo-hydrolase [Actinomycetota bacterium]|nr:MBL fold metallo-hydrolase [Actinomycetota bacterium]
MVLDSLDRPEQGEEGMSEHQFSIGSIECRVISAGRAAYPTEQMFAGVPDDQLAPALEGRLDANGNVPTNYSCLLVRSGGRIALIETGLGDTAREWGLPEEDLQEALQQAGVSSGDVDLVVISHAHPDHIGGLTSAQDGERAPAFGETPVYFWRDEWEFWTSEEGLAQVPGLVAGPARTHLPVLGEADVVEAVDEEMDVLPGVRLIPAPGHTPGHMAVALTSGGEGALYMGDAAMHELHLEHPDWLTVFDAIPALTVQSRRKLIEQAVRENRLVVVYHMFTPGWMRKSDGAYMFEPAEE